MCFFVSFRKEEAKPTPRTFPDKWRYSRVFLKELKLILILAQFPHLWLIAEIYDSLQQ
jgi:hypothetical protein